MSRLLSGLFRGFCFLALVACVAAVAMARLAPRPASFKILTANRLEAINGYHFASSPHVPRLLDRETGKSAPLDLPGDDYVDCAAFSSWADEEGTSQVVGRWVRRSGPEGMCEGYGLARFTFPGGEAIDRVPLEIMPVGRPCFMPGGSAELVFSGGDGRLYRFTFDRDAGDEPSRPTALGWREASAGKAPVAMNDPVWPSDSRLRGRLIVSLTTERTTATRRGPRHNSQLWWLELNADRTQVVAAGRLTRPGPSAADADTVEESQPNVTTTPDGGLALAYLSRRPGERGWNLRAAPIEVDPATGIPAVREEETATLAESRAHTAPIFSPDGRWVYTLARREPKPEGFERLALPEAIRTSGSSRSHVALRTTRSTWN